MREPRSADNVVAERLRSVLADPVGGRGRGRPGPAPRWPGAAPALAQLAVVGEPLNWSDIIPAWPDDVDLEPVSSPPSGTGPVFAAAGDAPPPAAGSAEAEPLGGSAVDEGMTGFPATSAWATPPVRADCRPPPPDGSGSSAEAPSVGQRDPFPSPLGDLMDPDVRPASRPPVAAAPGVFPVADGIAGNAWRPLPPPAWVLADEDVPASGPLRSGSWPEPSADPAFSSDEDDEPAGLSAAGAFGGPAGGGRRIGVRAFDPGRRGVRALAVVAAVVIVVAAFLAWRARPRVDPVAPPSFDVAGSAGVSRGEQADVPVAAPRSAGSAAAEVVVAVGGKVRKPGLVRLPSGARVADALTAAGGAEPGVDVAMLNLARKVVDGELILVGVTPPPGTNTGPAAPAGTAPAGGAPAGGPVNLNTATLADLDTLPGVGPVLAQRILDARGAQGGFKAVSDLRKVDGIGDARYEQLKDLVTV